MSACVEGQQANFNSESQYPATTPASIQVVVVSEAPHKYVVLGAIRENPMANMQLSIEDAKVRAAKMGANAMTVPALTGNGMWLNSLAIRYTDN